MRSLRPAPWGLALAAASMAGLLTEGIVGEQGGLAVIDVPLALLAATPLAWGTRSPLATLAAVELGAILCAAQFDAIWAATAVVLVQLFIVALLGDRQRSVVVGFVTSLAVTIAVVIVHGAVEVTAVVGRVALVFAVVAVGDMLRSRQALRAAARERAELERREREEEAQRRASAERLRIAQELHDTLAHSLVAINVRASVALDLGDSQDPAAALQDIKQVSATALRDLRATLSLLREHGDAAPTAPAFDLAALPSLIGQAEAAGLHTELDLEVDGVAIPSAIGGAAYRIVQEALTNVLRHAGATSARVSVHAKPDVLDIEVTDDGRANATGAHPGLGLRGMWERSAALGGSLDVGPLDDRGWRVHAVLPLTVATHA